MSSKWKVRQESGAKITNIIYIRQNCWITWYIQRYELFENGQLIGRIMVRGTRLQLIGTNMRILRIFNTRTNKIMSKWLICHNIVRDKRFVSFLALCILCCKYFGRKIPFLFLVLDTRFISHIAHNSADRATWIVGVSDDNTLSNSYINATLLLFGSFQ